MKRKITFVFLLGLAGCSSSMGAVPPVDSEHLQAYSNYCVIRYDGTRSAESVAASGFANVEQQCGIFFDKLAELTQEGRFASDALIASNLGTQTIMQAAKAAARSVTIVAASYTLSEAVLNAFIKQYAFAPYLYKIRELTWQSFQKHQNDNLTKLAQLKSGNTPDDYCDAAILIQQHANICTISFIQDLLDQQIANSTKVTDPTTKADAAAAGSASPVAPPHMRRMLATPVGARANPAGSEFVPLISPNYSVK
jgi:hypothetical protein